MNSERKLRWSRPARAFSFGLLTVLCFFFTNVLADADTIYVSDAWASAIVKFNSSGSRSVFANMAPAGMAFDSSGHLYAATGSSIEKFDSNGNGSVFAHSGFDWPTGSYF